MENKRENEDAETTVARALGRSLAKQQRRDNLGEIAIVLGGALALVAIQFVLRQSYYLVMAAQVGLPWILYGWLARKGSVGVFLSWIWSSIVSFFLTMGYFGYASLVDRTTIVAAACIIGAILFAVIAMHRPEMLAKSERPLAVFVYCFLVVYSYAAIFQVNCLLDKSSVKIYTPVVLKKVYGFRGAYGLLVDAWSPDQRLSAASLLIRPGSTIVPPSREVFNTARTGDTICVVQKAGSLGMSWYTAQMCPWTGGRVALGSWGRSF